MLHLTALVLMAGTTLVDYLAYSSLWRSLEQKERPTVLLGMMAKLPRVAGIGAALLILSGIGMMALTHGVFGEQLWFRIKFGLVILVILNSLLVGRRQGVKLQRMLNTDTPSIAEEMSRIRRVMARFHFSQLLLFVFIIFLSVFKFN
nr:hypothetical protein [uncultured Mucilaginibacter sp.]